MPKVLVLRPGHAIGDAVFITPVPRLLTEQGFTVDLACMEHNFEVFKNNPFINELIKMPHVDKLAEWTKEFEEKRATYDKIYSMAGHIEVGLLYRTDADWGTIPDGMERREKAKDLSYQDHILSKVGIEARGLLPEFYFTKEEQDKIDLLKQQKAINKEKLVLWQWQGSSKSKDMVFAPLYLKEILKKMPHTVHYVFTQDPNWRAQIPDHPNVHDAWGKSGIRESIMFSEVADLVVGPESFLVNAAGAFDTPKVIFFSHSAPENLAKYYKNCYAVVPNKDVTCHPCYLIHVDFRRVFHPEKRAIAREYERNCQTYAPNYPYRTTGYKCCFYLPHDKVVETITNILKQKSNGKRKKK